MIAQNLAQLAEARFALTDRPFIVGDDGRHFSYLEFWSLAGGIARRLTQLGVKSGDRVAVQLEKSIEALAIFWACVRGGFVFLPLNTAYTASEVSYFLQDAEPAVFVCDSGYSFDNLVVVNLSQLIEGLTPNSFENHVSLPDDLAAILYTSGTTGRSKGAMLSHWNLASNALALIDTWHMQDTDVLLHALPVYHTHGLFTATNTVFLSGARMIFQRRFDGDAVMAKLPQANVLMGVPTFYTRLLQHNGLTHDATKHMRLFVSGSAPLLAETHNDFSARTGHAILERYGMTETSMNASNPYVGERRAGTVGFALPGVSIRINAKGVIEIKGPSVFKGYWRNPQKTMEEFTVDGYFVTGDLGHFDVDGYLVISGRAKDLIITGGFNVYPKEVELLIDALDGVDASAVIGVPHPDFGEGVTAVVVAKKGATLNVQTMLSELKLNIASFKMPKQILIVDTLPRNAMGKVQKNVLRETYAGLYRPV